MILLSYMKKKLLIIGGGFVGSLVAKELENKFETTLIDKKEYFEYYPGILRIVINNNHKEKIKVKYKNYLKKSLIINGTVLSINNNFVTVGRKNIPYEYLVICAGTKYKNHMKNEFCIPSYEIENFDKDKEKIKKAKNITIVGGGLVGIELAAELIELKNKKITILQSRETIIHEENKKSINYATEYLEKNGVNIILNTKVKKIIKKTIITNENKKINSDLIFLCIGKIPNTDFMLKNFSEYLDEKRYIKTDEYLRLINHNNIFAGGDIISINKNKLAQNAKEHAKIIINNIINSEENKKLKEYRPKEKIKVISLGTKNGIIT